MSTTIVQLSSGYEAEVRPVPPTAYLDLELQFNRDNPPPKKPTIKAKSVAGHEEELLASMSSPEWAEYDQQVELRKDTLRAQQINFAYNYAVVRWRKQLAPGAELAWQSDVDDDWRPDPLCPDKSSPRRVLFIKYELIASLEDDRKISNPLAASPLTDQEVQAALGKFQPDTERARVGRSARQHKGRKG